MKGWKELDVKMIECKEVDERNRGTYDQVMTDIARISEAFANRERVKSAAQECIEVKDQEIIQVIALLKRGSASTP